MTVEIPLWTLVPGGWTVLSAIALMAAGGWDLEDWLAFTLANGVIWASHWAVRVL